MSWRSQNTPPDKDGLEKALEVTKYIIGISGAFVAFLTGTTFLTQVSGLIERVIVSLAILAFAASAVAGLFVLFRGCTMLSQKNYDLLDWHISVPGIVNVVAFGVGALLVGGLVVYSLLLGSGGSDEVAAADCSFTLFCLDF